MPSRTWPASGPCSPCSGSRPPSRPGRWSDTWATLRIVGGAILIVLGLNLGRASSASRSSSGTGGRSMPAPRGRWRPRPARCPSAARGRVARRPSATASVAGWSARAAAGSRPSGSGAIFAIGWTPCIGIILGGILTMAVSTGTVLPGAVLLVALHDRSGAAVPAHRRGVRPRAAVDGAPGPSRPGGVDDRRVAGRRDRGRHDLRLAGPHAAATSTSTRGSEVRRATGVQPQARAPRPDRPVHRPPARRDVRGDRRRASSSWSG